MDEYRSASAFANSTAACLNRATITSELASKAPNAKAAAGIAIKARRVPTRASKNAASAPATTTKPVRPTDKWVMLRMASNATTP